MLATSCNDLRICRKSPCICLLRQGTLLVASRASRWRWQASGNPKAEQLCCSFGPKSEEHQQGTLHMVSPFPLTQKHRETDALAAKQKLLFTPPEQCRTSRNNSKLPVPSCQKHPTGIHKKQFMFHVPFHDGPRMGTTTSPTTTIITTTIILSLLLLLL